MTEPETLPSARAAPSQTTCPENPATVDAPRAAPVPELGGRAGGPDPTRYGDWEKNGRCIDF